MRKHTKGQTLFAVIVFLGIIFILSVALLTYTINNRLVIQRKYNAIRAFNIAEAGVNKATWCLNHSDECGIGYTGENGNFGGGTYTVTVESTGDNKIITSNGSIQNINKTLRVTVTDQPTSIEAAFYYGVQIGAGGLIMDNNAGVEGNVYSNGSITAGSGATISGSVIVAGGTALTPDQQQTIQTGDFEVGRTNEATDVAQSFKAGETNILNKISLYIKKVGSPSNATIRIVTDNGGNPSTTELTSGILNTILVTTEYGWIDVTFSSTPALVQDTLYWLVFDVGAKNSNKYWIWAKHDNAGYGNGEGKHSENWSSSSWTSAVADFTFKTWMGGIVTEIDGLTVPYVAESTVHANTIKNSNISANIQCQDIDSTTVAGNITCGDIDGTTISGNVTAGNVTNSTISGNLTCETQSDNTVSGSINCPISYTQPDDPPPENMPISEAQIAEWEKGAKDSDIIPLSSCTDGAYHPADEEVLGPVKIECDLKIDTNNITVYINGPLWVEGDILITNGVQVRLSSDFGENSTVIIADDPDDQNTKGKITISNNADVTGSGTEGSYIMLVSTNKGILPDSDVAIKVNNNVTGAILYTSQGMIEIDNNVSLKEATGFALHLKPLAEVIYESGLANVNFASGPGGIWSQINTTWQEIY